LKILFFSDHFYPEPSAPAAHVYERAALWVRAGHEVTVVTAAPNFPEGRVYAGYRNAWRFREVLNGIRVVRVKTYIARNEGFVRRTLDYITYMMSSFFFAFFEPRPDVVVSTSPHLFAAVGGVLHALIRRVPHVFELRDLWPATIAANTGVQRGFTYRMLERLELWLYRKSARVLAFTDSYRRDLVHRGIPAQKIDVVINGANLAMFKPAKSRDAEVLREYGLENHFVVGYVGTLGLSQGLENVIEAASLLRDAPIRFFFVGVGAAREPIKQEAQKRGLRNVVFAPRQRKEDVPRFWSVCHVSLVHLKNDPVFATVIPSKIFESMAMGLPMVYCGPAGEGSQIVERHAAGIYVAGGDPAALAAAVETLSRDPSELARLAHNSAAAAGEYSRERQAALSLAVFERAVGGAPA
jgi:glycosyltransferase involved in cell wall biosynthesis